MCIAILKKPNGIVTKAELQMCFDNNPDMCGFAFVHNKKVYISKGYKNFEEFFTHYNQVASLNDRNILIHFRIATSGGVNTENCHPFYVHEGKLAIIHNGVISGLGASKQEGSKNDTRIFIDKFLSPFSGKMWYRKEFRDLISQAIGSYNKFVLLNNKDEYFIVNEEAGHWECNCWFSNNSYKAKKITKPATYYTGGYNYNNINLFGNKKKEEEKKEYKTEKENAVIVKSEEGTYRYQTYCDCCGEVIEYDLKDNKPKYCDECLDWAREQGIKSYSCDICGNAWESHKSYSCPQCKSYLIQEYKDAGRNLDMLVS